MAYNNENDETMKTEQASQEMPESNPIQLSAKDPSEMMDKQKKLVDTYMKKFQAWENWRKPFENVWDEIYRLYMNSKEKRKTPSRSNITVPIAFQTIEAAVPKIVNTIFSSQIEFFDVIPTNPEDEEFASVIKLLLSYQLMQADFFVKFVDFVKQLLMYGTSYFKVYWKVKRQWVWERKPIREENFSIMGFKLGSRITGWEETKSYKVIEKRPEVDVMDILDVFPDPEARNEKEGSGIFLRSWININDLKQMGKGQFPVYANVESEELKPDKSSFSTSRNQRLSARGASDPSIADPDQIEIIEYWGQCDLDDDGIKEEVYLVFANRKVLLKAEPNPFHHQKRPIVRSVLFPVPMEWYGIGLIEPVISNIHELWTLRRQRIDNINMIINRMWKVNSIADVDLDTLVSVPNGIVITDDMNAVEPLETPNVTADAYNEAGIVQADIENATAPRSMQGTPESGRLGRTARGAQLIITQALEKFGTIIKLSAEEMAIKRILRMFHQLNLQFIDDDDVLRDPGMYGHLFQEQVTPEMIRAEVKFNMVGISDMVNKEAKINQIVSFMGVFGKVLSPETISDLAKEVWRLQDMDPRKVNIQGMQAAVMPGNVVDEQITQSVLGQTQNQGAQAAPAIPGIQSTSTGE